MKGWAFGALLMIGALGAGKAQGDPSWKIVLGNENLQVDVDSVEQMATDVQSETTRTQIRLNGHVTGLLVICSGSPWFEGAGTVMFPDSDKVMGHISAPENQEIKAIICPLARH